MRKPLYLIKHDKQGAGGFLAPPGHPAHFYSVEGYWGGRIKPVSRPDLIAGLGFLLTDEYGDVPADVKTRASEIIKSARLRCSESWLRNVYGYFRNSYSPDGADRNVGHAVSSSKLALPANHHLGYLMVRSYFPDHRPRLDLISNPEATGPGYGTHECPKCSARVQYESREDAYAARVQYESREDAYAVVTFTPWRYNIRCPAGGWHW